MAYKPRIESNNLDLTSILSTINELPEAGSGGTTLTVTTNEDATVTVTNGSETYTDYGPTAVFEGLSAGVWTITVTRAGVTASKTIELGDVTTELSAYKMYGISRNIESSSPVWSRTDDAIGLTATASVGTTAGHSDFDNCYPWSGIQRETLSTNDVMVKIPKFYFRRYREGDIEYIKISDEKAPGFTLHPLFNHGGVESECAYVGAYKISNGKYSVSGATPQVSCSRATMRDNVAYKGGGWSLIDIAAVSAIQMLFLVEFATNNAQGAIGTGYCNDSANTAALRTGTCDSVPNLTGRPSGTESRVDVVWRGIEGLWGNVWEWVDGVNFNGGRYYVCNDQTKYADNTTTNYDELSFGAATSWSKAFITGTGLDEGNNTHIMLPSAASGGSDSTYMCDAVWTTTNWMAFHNGGCWLNDLACGLFLANMSAPSSYTSNYIGSRLLYIPS